MVLRPGVSLVLRWSLAPPFWHDTAHRAAAIFGLAPIGNVFTNISLGVLQL
jgi:hypothetical protein